MSIDERTTAIMEDIDCIDKRLDTLIAELQLRTAERDALKVLCQEQEVKLKNTPDMRSIVGELRIIRNLLQAGKWTIAEDKFSALLRRLDQESQ